VHADIARQNHTTDAVEKLIDVGQCRLNFRVIKGAKLIVAEQSGHMIPVDQPGIIIETIIEVIQLTK
jgi:pimeloyl-ACP methyl ester carboxylesterase